MIGSLQPVLPSQIWTAWTFDPLVVVPLVVAGVLWIRGARRRRRAPSRAVRSAFFGGLAVLVVALVSPLDAASDALFSAHMVQHLLLIVVAAPLLVLGRPLPMLAASAPSVPRTLGPHVIRAGIRAGRVLRRPAVAWGVATVSLWVWHLPLLYDGAVAHGALHAAEHLCFLGSAVLVWSVALGPLRPDAAPARALMLFATALQGALLGALLLLAPVALYAVHANGPSAWGLTPLQDQQLAGAIMWIPPSVIYLTVTAILLHRWLEPLDEAAGTAGQRRAA